MKIITTISIVITLASGIFAYFNYRSTQEYFGYFEAEKVLIEYLDKFRNKNIETKESSNRPKSFENFYRIISTDTFFNQYEFHLLFSDKAKFTFHVIRKSDGWIVTYIENK